MSANNPLAGGPDYIRLLAKAIEKDSRKYSWPPPASGGTQISLRLTPDRLQLLEVLGTQSGWNRNQLMVALMEKGLFMLFEILPDSDVSKIMDELAAKVTTKS